MGSGASVAGHHLPQCGHGRRYRNGLYVHEYWEEVAWPENKETLGVLNLDHDKSRVIFMAFADVDQVLWWLVSACLGTWARNVFSLHSCMVWSLASRHPSLPALSTLPLTSNFPSLPLPPGQLR